MSEKRREREIVYEVRIRVWTSFMQQVVEGFMDACLKALALHHAAKGYKTTFEVQKRVLDAKTKQPFI